MKMYKTKYREITISEFEVIKVTNKTVSFIDPYHSFASSEEIIRNSTEGLNTTWHEWHKTKEDAIDYLLKRTEGAIKSHKQQIISLESDLEKLNNLKNDKS